MRDLIELIDSKKPGVAELDIKLAEDKLNVTFPKQYIDLFILSNNAQVGEWTLFPVKDSKNLKRTWDDIVRQNIDIRDEKMPVELIAIGDDGTGDKLCFRNVGSEHDNKIYIWYHETGEIEELASSLKEFITLYSRGVEEDERT